MSGVQSMSQQQVAEYRKHFSKFDLDGDGSISNKELKRVFRKMGYQMSDQQIDAIMKANDIDSDGSLSFDEFLRAMPKNTEISEEEHSMAYIRRKFLQYDTDGNGEVSLEEAHQILEKELSFSHEQSVELVQKYDKNGDGQLSYEEFAKFYTKVKAKAKQMREMFDQFDKDGSGSISVDEVKVMLRQLDMPDAEIERLVSVHDKNNDGELQYEEFVAFLWHT